LVIVHDVLADWFSCTFPNANVVFAGVNDTDGSAVLPLRPTELVVLCSVVARPLPRYACAMTDKEATSVELVVEPRTTLIVQLAPAAT
jgi:hypothetical protein